jgi:pyroglutamyl-peptidase
MPVLVTGFEAFGTHHANPSGLVVERLPSHRGRIKAVLPTSYERAGHQVERLLGAHAPSAVLLLGLSARADGIVLERRARNRDYSQAVDNDGVQRIGSPIALNGPESYASTLPLERFADAARQLGLSAQMSDDAGGFVCNHVYYRAAHFMAQQQNAIAPCGFVHVPLAEDTERLARIQACVERFLDVLEVDQSTQG